MIKKQDDGTFQARLTRAFTTKTYATETGATKTCVAVAGSTHRTPSLALLFAICLNWIIVDTAVAQGPLRRIGDRIRERSGGPLAPGLNAAEPAVPPVANPPQPRRPLLGRQDAAGTNQAPAIAATQPPGVRPQGVGQTGARSANYNRAVGRVGAGPTNAAVPLVRQSSAIASRGDLRGGVNDRTAGPNQTPQPGVPQPASGQVSTASVAIAEPGNRARLGVVVDTPPTITPAGLPPRRPRGAMVSEVQPGSAAAVAGIVVGDLIVGVDGRVITSVRDLTEQLNRYEPGDRVELQWVRDDRLMVTDLSLAGADGLAKGDPSTATPRPPATGSSGAVPSGGAVPSIVSGLGAAIGGLFGGSAGRSPEPQSPAPATERNDKPSGLSAEAIRNSLPETLPAPAPEKDDR